METTYAGLIYYLFGLEFIITMVFERLHTTKWSWFLGKKCTLKISDAPTDLKECVHSVVITLHTFTVLLLDTHKYKIHNLKIFIIIIKANLNNIHLITLWPSTVYTTSLTNYVNPLNSLSVLPDFKPWILFKNVKKLLYNFYKNYIFLLLLVYSPYSHIKWTSQNLSMIWRHFTQVIPSTWANLFILHSTKVPM